MKNTAKELNKFAFLWQYVAFGVAEMADPWKCFTSVYGQKEEMPIRQIPLQKNHVQKIEAGHPNFRIREIEVEKGINFGR